MKNYGYIKDFRTRDNYVLGGLSKVPKIVLQEDGQWDDYLPEKEYQNVNGVETSNCTGFGTLSVIEMIFKRKFGLTKNYSDRALGILSGTYPPGNSPQKVAETARAKGLLIEDKLPFKDIKDVDEYYSPSPLPESLKQECLLWTNLYKLMHEWVEERDVKEALRYSPLGVGVYAWEQNEQGYYYKSKGQEDNHWAVLYGYDDKRQVWKIYDSYDNTLKLYTYESGLEAIKRYYLEVKTPQEQYENIITKFLGVLKNYLAILSRSLGFKRNN